MIVQMQTPEYEEFEQRARNYEYNMAIEQHNGRMLCLTISKEPNPRFECWNAYVDCNESVVKCFCCKLSPITFNTFDCGHVQPRSKGGTTNLQNLKPICQNCNQGMLRDGNMNMIAYMEKNGFGSLQPYIPPPLLPLDDANRADLEKKTLVELRGLCAEARISIMPINTRKNILVDSLVSHYRKNKFTANMFP